ncbi:MAG: hypothetical protein MK116_06235 [Phycisphaerales bacterium]|nr:hypothetical protein [Phycisphaerales bacterium]
MAQKGKRKKQNRPTSQRAKPVTVASRKSRQRPLEIELNRPEISTETTAAMGWWVIALTLLLIAVPSVLGVIHIAGSIPAFDPPRIFPPWFSLGAVVALLILWINYAAWCRKR